MCSYCVYVFINVLWVFLRWDKASVYIDVPVCKKKFGRAETTHTDYI